VLATQKDEDAGDERDNSSNKAEVESENSDQADKDQINRQQKHSDVFCEGHGAMICGYSERSRGCNAAATGGEARLSIPQRNLPVNLRNPSTALRFARDDIAWGAMSLHFDMFSQVGRDIEVFAFDDRRFAFFKATAGHGFELQDFLLSGCT